MKLELEPIGIVHSPYKNRYEAPRQGGEEVSEIIVFDAYEEGLKDIEGFSHLHILYYLHKSRGYSLSVKTPWDSEPHGLFATRSPHRPTAIGYSVVELIKREVEELKQKIGVKPAHYARTLIPCDKGGPFGYCKIKIENGNMTLEPATEEEELAGLEQFYQRVVYAKKHMRRQYPTFEKWIESLRR